jgi:hypothetical protein
MNDLSFVPAEHAQAEDRAYRYGQKNNVLVYYPIFENTIEGVIYDILNKKKKVIGTVMGDEVSDNAGDVVEEILDLINIYIENWAHRVRWGGTFNENGGSLPTTNDVSGGIGMEQRSYSAGDAIGCCQNTTGLNKSLSFKWFIR